LECKTPTGSCFRLAFNSLSEDTKADVANYGNNTEPEGMLHRDSVFVVAEELASEAYPEAIILHEMTS
jgi:hypothetical protein